MLSVDDGVILQDEKLRADLRAEVGRWIKILMFARCPGLPSRDGSSSKESGLQMDSGIQVQREGGRRPGSELRLERIHSVRRGGTIPTPKERQHFAVHLSWALCSVSELACVRMVTLASQDCDLACREFCLSLYDCLRFWFWELCLQQLFSTPSEVWLTRSFDLRKPSVCDMSQLPDNWHVVSPTLVSPVLGEGAGMIFTITKPRGEKNVQILCFSKDLHSTLILSILHEEMSLVCNKAFLNVLISQDTNWSYFYA